MMPNSDLELIKTLRNLSKTQDLWAAGTAAGRLEDMLAVLVKETCRCGRTDESDPAKHYDGLGLDGRPTACRYRHLVEQEKPRRTVLDELEKLVLNGHAIGGKEGERLLRLARAASEEYKRQRPRRSAGSPDPKVIDEFRDALRDIDPMLVEDE